jgi:hypothetical protein
MSISSESRKILSDAAVLVAQRLAVAPGFDVFESISAQLIYLESLADSANQDRSSLGKINVGLYAVREFEEADPDLATALKRVQFIADQMRKGLKV